MVHLIDASQLALEIPNGSTIALVGFGGMGQCDKILKAIGECYKKTGTPNHLTVFHTAGQSDKSNGIEHIAIEGLIERVIGGHWGLAPKMRRLIEENKIDCYCWPQGQLTHLLRAMANKMPGQISPVGLGTFVDPRVEGGKINERTKKKEDLVQVISINQEEFLLYPSIPFDYVFIRGTSIDENGNITTEEEPLKLEILSAAHAAKAYGGKVIAQVKYMAERTSFHPKDVVVPGYLVDAVVLAENPETEHRQVPSTVYSPIFSGDLRTPAKDLTSLPLDIRKVIGRRAIQELTPSAVVNLGIGIPGDVIGPITNEEGINQLMTLTLESGIIGGIPIGENEFGIARNADAILDHEYLFDYYHGAGIDITFMGAAEVDQFGNVNVSKFGSRTVGCGGFIDITQTAKKVVFCTTFTSSGLEVSVENNKLNILREGMIKKFTNRVQQITFSGAYAADHSKKVMYVTERAVFQLTKEGLMLIEIAPGIDLEKDILNEMDFPPLIASDLKEMDMVIFKEGIMGCKKFIDKVKTI
ncbi:acyl CoA:acetate/3-ketoacid CoA transferase [Bacillus ginsengihumi]|uniref:Acyl CoA:acetate/3-ketoacid CoA transferase n=1 Tax=Heyndrickxia ginsengihumi TaxID=363870 RepID=A0A0A6V8U8_9BACI|nr:CoA-transferase [Heyndrickxia ginsengihumi]KHD84495.1 CoA-transferase [Heyndrickxia ginsengihumi]MBE6183514.1 acyl CoA:acetate/3-ketoacid CoA transferase [Bacillus sp. (in: firmicutes)]MCM3023218.1 acyl CoA:acetate/3-ketoacid CoA transferase [Heyndrickxia ginsengihumi]NEY19299.1 acyl CoA:acetate/3-ketoacid CoA transferase [Heyndrickxia ginsengihumi]